MTIPELRSEIEQGLLGQIKTQLERKPREGAPSNELQDNANTLRTLILAYETFKSTVKLS